MQPLSAPTAPGIQGAAPVVAEPNNGGAPPTAPSTPAPSTSTSAPPASPVAVVSSQPAAAQVQKIQQTSTQASAALAASNAAAAANPTPPVTPQVTTSTSTSAQTPEQQIASQPSDGNQFIYDADGNQHQIPIGSPVPSGYTTTNPTAEPTTPVVATAQTNLYLYKQYSDGTYGRYTLDQNGNYTYAGTATAQDFQGAQAQQTATTQLDSILAGGTMPLTADQQSQVAGLKAQYAQLIQQQQTANANLTGAMTIFQSLHGGNGQADTQTAIAQTITYGAQQIADLNAKQASAVAAMEDGFETDDLNALKTAYDDYNTAETAKDKAIADIKTALDTAQKTTNAAIDQQTIDTAIGNQITSGVTDPTAILKALTAAGINATAKQVSDTLTTLQPNAAALTDLMKTITANGAPASVIKAVGAAKTLNDAYVAAGDYGDGGTGVIAQYNLYKAGGGTESLDQWTQDYNDAKSTGTTLGKSAVPNTVDSSFGSVTIPQSDGTSTNQLAYQNNNPGNLRLSNPPQSGASQGTGGFASFDTPADGYAALVNDVTLKVTNNPSDTLLDLISKYAPASDGNDPDSYAQTVATGLGNGVTMETPLSQIDPTKLAAQIASVESGTTVTPGWSTDDASPPPTGDAGNVPYGITGRTPNDIYQSAITLSLDKSATPQKFLGGLGGSSPAGLELKNAITNKSAALMTAAGVDQATLQQQFAGNSTAINKQITVLNNTQQSLTAANDGVNQVLSAFSNAGINANDSTYANQTLNSLSLNFTDSGTLRAYQAALVEIGNDYSAVFARVGSTNQAAQQRAQDIANGNITLGDLQQIMTEMQSQGQIVVQSSIGQIASISSGTGTDQVVKFLDYVNQVQPDAATQSTIQDSQDTVSSINTFVNESAANNTQYQGLLKQFPNATPSQIAQALGLQ
jgi:hypothetical protein